MQFNDWEFLMIDRQRGCLLGLAIGDVLGAAVEFEAPGSFIPVTGYRAGGPHGLAPGEWTDDTSMALALADSIASAGWDLNDQADRYVQWWRTGKYSVNGRCFDIGVATREALANYQVLRDARTSGNRSESSSGNGSIMRLAPVPIRQAHLYPDNVGELCRLAEESSLPTHASEQCLSISRGDSRGAHPRRRPARSPLGELGRPATNRIGFPLTPACSRSIAWKLPTQAAAGD